MAQQGILGAAMPVPLDISYIADTVVLLRFFEASGSVHRAISVVKKRTGPHESTIRELQIGPDRLRVGAALTHFQGVLTGVPSFTGARCPTSGQSSHDPSRARADLCAHRQGRRAHLAAARARGAGQHALRQLRVARP